MSNFHPAVEVFIVEDGQAGHIHSELFILPSREEVTEVVKKLNGAKHRSKSLHLMLHTRRAVRPGSSTVDDVFHQFSEFTPNN